MKKKKQLEQGTRSEEKGERKKVTERNDNKNSKKQKSGKRKIQEIMMDEKICWNRECVVKKKGGGGGAEEG